MNVFLSFSSLLLTAGGVLLIVQGNSTGWWTSGFFGLCSVIHGIPFLPRRWFEDVPPDSFLGRLRGDVQVPDPRHGTLEFDANGMRHRSADDRETQVAWPDVDRIMVYKLDCLATDCICVVFAGLFASSPCQIHEEMVGFNEIFAPLQAAFPTIPESWYFDVMDPPFATKPTLLFERKEGHSDD